MHRALRGLVPGRSMRGCSFHGDEAMVRGRPGADAVMVICSTWVLDGSSSRAGKRLETDMVADGRGYECGVGRRGGRRGRSMMFAKAREYTLSICLMFRCLVRSSSCTMQSASTQR